MGIVFAMMLSILIKSISSVVEIGIQMLITNGVGVSGYGDYTFFVSLIEGAYFVLFSGSVKLNTFYLSTPSSSLKEFKKNYILKYVVPIISVMAICFGIMRNPYGILSSAILFIYYFACDRSSVFFSKGQQFPALLGEYLFGRLIMLMGLLAVIKLDAESGLILLALFGLQFVIMRLWFIPFRGRIKDGTEEIKVPVRKLIEYQISDVASSIVSYSPAILQYVVGGAFTAGFTGIISIVRRFINFISGPTAKVFLPEFSRLYKADDRVGLEKSYLMIVRIQMVFIGTIGALLIGFPSLILKMFSPDLLQYSNVFTGTAICLLLIAGIGPVTGMLQMTGNEKICNRNQWLSIGIMIFVWIIFIKQPLFAVYGLCAQALAEGILKYYSVCKLFGKMVVPAQNYLLLWLPVIIERIVVSSFKLDFSITALLISLVAVGSWNLAFAMRDPMVNKAVMSKLQRK